VALKDLLVCLDASERSRVRLRLAADLAQRNGSCITALYLREWSPAQLARRQTAELAGRPLPDIEALNAAVEESIDRAEREQSGELEELARRYHLQAEWHSVAAPARNRVTQHARYADLSILDVDMPADGAAAAYGFSEQMLFTSGRPTLLIPAAGSLERLGAHVAVAWNSSRAAARALNDALPLLERSDRATVIALDPDALVTRHGALPVSQLLEHLRRHGITAQLIELADLPGDAIADALQSQAAAAGADMLVAGAHGHTWLHDVVLGSVTRDLLSRLRLPVLMSH